MILNNYRNILSAYSWMYTKNSDNTTIKSPYIITATDGTTNDGWGKAGRDFLQNVSYSLTGSLGWNSTSYGGPTLYVAAGSGNGETTAEMYNLEDPVITSDAIVQSGVVYNDGVVYNAIIRNRTDDVVEISELGWIVNFNFYTSATTYYTKNVLVAREVLSEHITLAAGEAAAVSVKLSWR